ncbi:MAG: hypothetical protein EB087_00660 [Flavobacteriales bacterium]|nr:hypothetical protein [Flavobacteriales bacterium]
MACHITGVYDVNRTITLDDDNYELVRDWAESVAEHQLQGIIFHNNFTSATCEKFKNDYISFIKIDSNNQFNPNVYRYFVYNDFLQNHVQFFKSIFVTDITDVTLLNNPFIDSYFIENSTAIFCGDEPKTLNNDWMRDHSTNLRNNISDYVEYESKFGSETLLNCGVIGSKAQIFFDFIKRLCAIHEYANSENQTAFTGDMGAFNYLARTQFNGHLRHGAPVNTVFKMYETERQDCWFRHK